MGVAVSVSTSTSARNCFSRSFWRTPKRCSSSMIDEPEVLELHVGLQELVRADHEVDAPGGEAFERRLHFLGAAEARQLGDAHREVGEAVREGLEVLFGQQRGGHQQRHLLAVRQRHVGGAQRHLRLAEAHVAADQAIHRAAGRHVVDHRLDRAGLVTGFLEAEAFGEGLVVVRLESERVALARGPLRVEVEQFRRGVVRLQRRLLLRLLPLPAAELVQRRGVRRGAAVAADEVEVRHRDVELGVVGVDELQELVGSVAQVERDEAEVAADAVLLVHHRIADAHLGEIAHHRVDVGALGRLARGAPHDAGIEFGLGDEGEAGVVPGESRRERRRHQHHAIGRGHEGREILGERGLHVVLGEVLLHRLAAAEALGHDRHPRGRGREVALQRRERDLRRGARLARTAASRWVRRRPAAARCARTASACR